MHNQLEQAVLAAAAEGGAPPQTYEVGPDAVIWLADGQGHLLDGATFTHWTRD